MKITPAWLKKENACEGGVEYYNTLNETDALKIMERLIADKKLDFANWTIAHLLTHENRVRYAIFAARRVLANYTKIYPDDKRVENAIVSAEKWLKNPSAEAYSACSAAASACSAADSACSAYSAAYSAYSACSAAYSACSAADSAAASAAYSACSAADSACSAYSAAYKLKLKIIRNGIELFKKQEAI